MSSTWAQNIQEATALRHRLHRSPELSWQEHGTAQIIRSQLKALDIPWRACANTGTVATLAPNATGRHIALRGDIDALPITEQTAVDWISQTPGVMHACGHDGHTATLMAVARWLKTNESALAGPVSLLFQPAEEGGHGARVMIEDGALDGVDWIFGWHNWPAIPFGQAVCPDGPVMAANGIFEIELTGRGGHASQPELCRDPVLAAAAVTLLADVGPDMVVSCEETFGPVAVAMAAKDADEALRIANDTPYGLGAAIWTANTAAAIALAADIESGQVAINGIVKTDPRLPSGGTKRSGYGRELGAHGIKMFVNAQQVWVGRS